MSRIQAELPTCSHRGRRFIRIAARACEETFQVDEDEARRLLDAVTNASRRLIPADDKIGAVVRDLISPERCTLYGRRLWRTDPSGCHPHSRRSGSDDEQVT